MVPKIKRHPDTWAEVLKPHTERFKTAYMMDLSVRFNAKGCKSMFLLLTLMGDRLEYTRKLELAVIRGASTNDMRQLVLDEANRIQKEAAGT